MQNITMTQEQLQELMQGMKEVKQGLQVVQTQTAIPGDTIPLKEIGDAFMKAKKGDVQPTTYSNKFGLYKNHILPIFGELMLSSITRIQIHEWVNQLLEDNYSMETIKPLKGMLYSIPELAVSDR